MRCDICLSNSGKKRISPGKQIYNGKFWLIEHAYPSKIKGWLVIVLKKHKNVLHDLTPEEFKELSMLQHKTSILLKNEFDCKKEYIACFSEKKHYQHIHFHIIPVAKNLSDNNLGPNLFFLGGKLLPQKEIINICSRLNKNIRT
ncbi:MAG: hypothetical protein COX78_01050 [Candidatus Levybacteria bacterium CG_4_10_14_0_2_um_filter_35_8]|nr:MAG: hypothetical protein COY68_04280 [Candidatus Levybacteria bacterium CG_4_10_14_0_8_um_filter_35_23]PJA00063.1 MAG: hypothetical protein COX78_01050 [Candidatus Levybacteria bacterium CG_4_10_14_0_2_um_filter_35_8]